LKKSIKNIIPFILFYLTSFITVLSQNYYKYSLEANASYGRLLAHRPAISPLIQNNTFSLESSIYFNSDGNKTHHYYYNYLSTGITINFTNSGNFSQIGNIYSVYGFLSIPLNKNKNPISIKMGLGIGWVEKIFDLGLNYQNTAIGSHLNSNIQFKIEKKLNIKTRHYLRYGIGFSHLSNASIQSPNLGLNFLSGQLSYQFGLKNNDIDSTTKEYIIRRKIFFSLYNSSAFKENSVSSLRKYYINENTVQIRYRKNIKLSFITGFDLLFNSSLENLETKIQSGYYLGNIIHFNKLVLGFQFGTYLYNKIESKDIFFQKIFTEYKPFNNFLIRLSLKSHLGKADFVSIGFGYEF